jgi:response regulator RpfG family c-di-GMP phosphodiesterase
MEFASAPAPAENPWKVLLVDDEPEVHAVTRLVLRGFRFEDRPLEILSAHSASEARAMLGAHPDLALMLLDVVMETEQAGLEVVRYARETLGNRFIRIVLRTGQPGQAPEQDVIRSYDINDYKEKTELTAQKLTTMLYAALRAYRDIMVIEANKRGLERVIEASASIFSVEKRGEFASAVLAQLTALVGVHRGALYCRIPTPGTDEPEHFPVAAATGDFAAYTDRNAEQALPDRISASLREAFRSKRHLFRDDHYVLHFVDSRKAESLLYVGETWRLSDLDYKLVEVFCTNVSIGYENLALHQEIVDAQLEMICLLAGAAESRSGETAAHVKRVGLLAGLLAARCGLDDRTVEDLRLAAPLHDIGKIGIPDAILNKPGPHDAEETRIMRTHAEIGRRMLASSARPLLMLAAEIAGSHHENWDGSGYPAGLAGEAIPISGRITMLADVYDALGSRRCYKAPWPPDEIRRYLAAQSGIKFEPRLVDLLFAHWDEAEAIRREFPD